jgi:two-component system cell cycle response regulator
LLKLNNSDLISFAQIAYDEARGLVSDLNDLFEYLRAPILASQRSQGCKLIGLKAQVDTISANLGLANVNTTVQPNLLGKSLALTQPAMDAIFTEVLENAQKFHPKHLPKINISVSSRTAQMATIQIQDDGITLSPKQLSYVWMPYIQAEKKFTGEVPGMGVGLPLVSTLLWQVGGNVRIENRTDASGINVELDIPLVD